MGLLLLAQIYFPKGTFGNLWLEHSNRLQILYWGIESQWVDVPRV